MTQPPPPPSSFSPYDVQQLSQELDVKKLEIQNSYPHYEASVRMVHRFLMKTLTNDECFELPDKQQDFFVLRMFLCPPVNNNNLRWILFMARLEDYLFPVVEKTEWTHCWNDIVSTLLVSHRTLLTPMVSEEFKRKYSRILREDAIFFGLLHLRLFMLARRFQKCRSSDVVMFREHDLFEAALPAVLEDAFCQKRVTAFVLKKMTRYRPDSMDTLSDIVLQQNFREIDDDVQMRLFLWVLSTRNKKLAHALFCDVKLLFMRMDPFQRLLFVEVLFEREQQMFRSIVDVLLETIDDSQLVEESLHPSLPVAVLSGIAARVSNVDACAVGLIRAKAEVDHDCGVCSCGIPIDLECPYEEPPAVNVHHPPCEICVACSTR